ncbi:MAG: hypothetical protein PHX51_02215 [Clostridia bacterium]|nr:hypothetical protein [Clostridia bacterium]
MAIESFQDLANAIVIQAVKDYRGAMRVLKRYPRNTTAKAIRKETESFFLSEWFRTLTNVDGARLLGKLQKEG